ncbi:hypothetical protein Tco_0256147 [Tanacetum coccineum]
MADAVKSTMKKVVPSMVDKIVNKIAKKLVLLYVAEGLLLDRQTTHTDMDTLIAEDVLKERETLRVELSMQIKFEKPAPRVNPCRIAAVRTRDHEDHHDDDAHPKGESSAKRHKTSEHGTYSMDDDQVPTEEVSPELLEEISGKVDEAQLQKAVNEMLRAQYPKAQPMTLLNQDIFYLKYGSSGPKKYVPSLHKYDVVPFPKNVLEELTSRWQHHIRRHEKKRDNPDEVYSESKIVEVVRTLYDLGHEHKYITEIVMRRADGKFDAISESYYKYLHKNDIEDLYMMCINGKVEDFQELDYWDNFIRSCVIWERVHDYQLGLESYQQIVNLTTPTITFPGIERKKLLTITSKPVVGLIYENNKKEKRAMDIKEIPKFCDATLIRVLKLVEKNNMDVKHGYADLKLSDNDAKYLRFYEEYIKDWLRHRDQMRCWESYMNGRPLESRRDYPE